ncbi:MAG: hypothetical protein R3C19_26055 [Planctomycetaceae bacterium]
MPDNEKPEDFPLVERFKKAEYLARALSEHMRQAYLPKLLELRAASKEFDAEVVSDQQMLDRMLAVLEAEDFAGDVYAKLRAYLVSIQTEMSPLLFVEDDSRQETEEVT